MREAGSFGSGRDISHMTSHTRNRLPQSISAFFAETLGAPLKNARWSWGAVHPDTGAVYLRVWEGEVQSVNGMRYARLGTRLKQGRSPGRPGYRERLQHVELIRQGAIAWCILCRQIDPAVNGRHIKSFRPTPIRGLHVCRFDSEDWLALQARAAER